MHTLNSRVQKLHLLNVKVSIFDSYYSNLQISKGNQEITHYGLIHAFFQIFLRSTLAQQTAPNPGWYVLPSHIRKIWNSVTKIRLKIPRLPKILQPREINGRTALCVESIRGCACAVTLAILWLARQFSRGNAKSFLFRKTFATMAREWERPSRSSVNTNFTKYPPSNEMNALRGSKLVVSSRSLTC